MKNGIKGNELSHNITSIKNMIFNLFQTRKFLLNLFRHFLFEVC